MIKMSINQRLRRYNTNCGKKIFGCILELWALASPSRDLKKVRPTANIGKKKKKNKPALLAMTRRYRQWLSCRSCKPRAFITRHFRFVSTILAQGACDFCTQAHTHSICLSPRAAAASDVIMISGEDAFVMIRACLSPALRFIEPVDKKSVARGSFRVFA